jgi:exodeoxyribonuclease VIII
MGRAIYAHPAAAMLLGLPGKAEQTFMWTDAATGLECKCRPDWMTDDGSIVVDLKTTEDASPAGFKKSIANYRYHVQAAFYLHSLEQATGVCPEQFIFIAVEKKPPHAVAVYAADPEMIKTGWHTAERDLDAIAQCRKLNRWPGYNEAIEPISLPPWMRPRADGTVPTSPIEIETF